MTTGPTPTDSSVPATLQPGQIVAGTYRIERLIGKGGMAVVWEATSQRTGKRVALKAIPEDNADASAAGMLRREALAAARVNHPNVVNIYDVIEHAGAMCIVMEMLEGEPLDVYLARKGFVGVDEAATLLLPAMRGVAAGHAMGVIHRDLKPKNIFLCVGPDGRMLTTKVVDFGISLVREHARGGLSAAEALPTHGTPTYMSPEHIQGLADIDGRADVYGFGVLFFEALTGQLPFWGEPGPELLARIIRDPPAKLTLFRPDLGRDIVSVVERAMAKEPKDRFPTLDDFIAAVEEITLGTSALPRALTPLAGVPLFAMTESRSGAQASSAPVVTSQVTPEPTDTRKLFSLSRAEAGGDPVTTSSAVPTGAGAETATQVPVGERPRRRRGWAGRVGVWLTFAGVFMAVAWLAFPSWFKPLQDRVFRPTRDYTGPMRATEAGIDGGAPVGTVMRQQQH